MKKQTAIALLGGDVVSAARCLGMSHANLHKWPPQLNRSMSDRVLAARLRLEWHVALKTEPQAQAELTELIADAMSV